MAVTSETEALRSALERVVFLECRVDQLASALDAEREEVRLGRSRAIEMASREDERTRVGAGVAVELSSRRAEVLDLSRRLGAAEAARAQLEARLASQGEGLQAALAEAQGQLAEERRRSDDREQELAALRAREGALEHGAESVFRRLIEWQAMAPGGATNVDLAEFIAELRSEIVELQHSRDEAVSREATLRGTLTQAGIDPANVNAAPPPRTSALDSATRLDAAGRLRLGTKEIEVAFADLATEAERRLAGELAAEVGSGTAAVRSRAARRLVALAGRRAAPALASAAGACSDPGARAVLVSALGRTAEPRALELAARFLEDPAAEVRGAAVEACAHLGDDDARQAALRRGFADPDALVRRRSVLATASVRGLDPGPLLAPMCADPSPQVRRVACAALAGTRDLVAASALVSALGDDDPTVAAAAADAAGKVLGRDLGELPGLPRMARSREIARLRAGLGARPLEPVQERSAPRLAATPARAAPPTKAAAPALPTDAAILGLVQASLRGAEIEEIAGELTCTPGSVLAAAARLCAEGRVVQRGRKLYLA